MRPTRFYVALKTPAGGPVYLELDPQDSRPFLCRLCGVNTLAEADPTKLEEAVGLLVNRELSVGNVPVLVEMGPADKIFAECEVDCCDLEEFRCPVGWRTRAELADEPTWTRSILDHRLVHLADGSLCASFYAMPAAEFRWFSFEPHIRAA